MFKHQGRHAERLHHDTVETPESALFLIESNISQADSVSLYCFTMRSEKL